MLGGRMKLGAFDIYPVTDGRFRVEEASMFRIALHRYTLKDRNGVGTRMTPT
jgi:hypothetical protein